MLNFAIGAVVGGCIGILLMSCLIVGARSDVYNDKK